MEGVGLWGFSFSGDILSILEGSLNQVEWQVIHVLIKKQILIKSLINILGEMCCSLNIIKPYMCLSSALGSFSCVLFINLWIKIVIDLPPPGCGCGVFSSFQGLLCCFLRGRAVVFVSESECHMMGQQLLVSLPV